MNKDTVKFKGKNSPLSNLYVVKEGIFYRGEYFNSSEQAYQWLKATKHCRPDLAEKILNTCDTYFLSLVSIEQTNAQSKHERNEIKTE